MARKNAAATLPKAAKSACDLEEIGPQRFLVHNRRVSRFLKSEGTIKGMLFELTGWRRDGLLARLRQNGFHVSTLEDQIEALPLLPPAVAVGPVCVCSAHRTERFSSFDPLNLVWMPVMPLNGHNQGCVHLFAGWIIRRRHGRGPARFYRVLHGSDGMAGLTPLDETLALLAAYAQATLLQRPALQVVCQAGYASFPAIELPLPHRKVLLRIGKQTDTKAWIIEQAYVPLAQKVYQRLQVPLTGE